MNKQDFSTAKVGDKLWSIQLGECEVIKINLEDELIACQNSDFYSWHYNYEGTLFSCDLTPSLFWSNPNIQIPDKPKRKVKKEEKIYLIQHGYGRLLYFDLPPILAPTSKVYEAILTYEIEE